MTPDEVTTVFVQLLDEGTIVFRPAPATHVSESVYRLRATSNYDPDDEIWEFPPDTLVRCEMRNLSGERVLVATARAQ